MTEPIALKADDAAKALGISARTLADWTAAGRVPSIKIGGVRLYSIDALRKWALEESRTEGRDGQAKALGNGVGLPATWGRPVGRRRERTPTPIRDNRAGGEADAR